jgi:nucleoside-diphosphate-sugar epimerase
MRAVVTGVAGFIGSHLCDRLLAGGHEVVGIDCFSDFYSRETKQRNIASARDYRKFIFHELDLAEGDVRRVIDGADVVYHLACRSGIWGTRGNEFGDYLRDNVVATQRLLESLDRRAPTRFVYASSWSVYGDAERVPTKEASLARPLSAYGVTKLAGENLAHLYSRAFGVPVTTLRYFPVYGPRQRPDMAIARFMHGLNLGEEVEILGDGNQTRDFTFVADVVEATTRAAQADVAGKVINIGGGSRTSINAALTILEEISGMKLRRRYGPARAEDQRHSTASINLARRHLSWEPRVSLHHGLFTQWSWFLGQADRDNEFRFAAV